MIGFDWVQSLKVRSQLNDILTGAYREAQKLPTGWSLQRFRRLGGSVRDWPGQGPALLVRDGVILSRPEMGMDYRIDDASEIENCMPIEHAHMRFAKSRDFLELPERELREAAKVAYGAAKASFGRYPTDAMQAVLDRLKKHAELDRIVQ